MHRYSVPDHFVIARVIPGLPTSYWTELARTWVLDIHAAASYPSFGEAATIADGHFTSEDPENLIIIGVHRKWD